MWETAKSACRSHAKAILSATLITGLLLASSVSAFYTSMTTVDYPLAAPVVMAQHVSAVQTEEVAGAKSMVAEVVVTPDVAIELEELQLACHGYTPVNLASNPMELYYGPTGAVGPEEMVLADVVPVPAPGAPVQLFDFAPEIATDEPIVVRAYLEFDFTPAWFGQTGFCGFTMDGLSVAHGESDAEMMVGSDILGNFGLVTKQNYLDPADFEMSIELTDIEVDGTPAVGAEEYTKFSFLVEAPQPAYIGKVAFNPSGNYGRGLGRFYWQRMGEDGEKFAKIAGWGGEFAELDAESSYSEVVEGGMLIHFYIRFTDAAPVGTWTFRASAHDIEGGAYPYEGEDNFDLVNEDASDYIDPFVELTTSDETMIIDDGNPESFTVRTVTPGPDYIRRVGLRLNYANTALGGASGILHFTKNKHGVESAYVQSGYGEEKITLIETTTSWTPDVTEDGMGYYDITFHVELGETFPTSIENTAGVYIHYFHPYTGEYITTDGWHDAGEFMTSGAVEVAPLGFEFDANDEDVIIQSFQLN